MIGIADNTLTLLYNTEPVVSDAVDEQHIYSVFSSIEEQKKQSPYLFTTSIPASQNISLPSIDKVFMSMMVDFIFKTLGVKLKEIKQKKFEINEGVLIFSDRLIPLPVGKYSIATEKINKVIYPTTKITIKQRQKTLL